MPTKHIGDLLICMRAIFAIQTSGKFDDCRLVIDQRYQSLVEMTGHNISLLHYPRSGNKDEPKLAKAWRMWRFYRQLRSQKYTAVIDFDGTILSSRTCRQARAALKIGPHFSKRPSAYTQTVAVNTESHKFQDYAQLLAALDIPMPEPGYPNLQSGLSNQTLTEKLPGLKPSIEQPLVCIHAGATKAYKQWGLDKFAAVADQLMEQGWQCVFIGAGNTDQSNNAAICDLMKHEPIDSCNQLNLKELTALFERADIYIGNDSGPMHLCAATKTPTIGLFGPTSDVRWRPLGNNATAVRGPVSCATDCAGRAKNCSQQYRCITALPYETVLTAIEDQTNTSALAG